MEMRIKAQRVQDFVDAIRSTGNDEFVLELKDDRWLIKSIGAATVIGAAVLMPERGMEKYDRRNYDSIGVPVKKIENCITGSDQTLDMWMVERTLNVKDETGFHAELATIDPESVNGVMNTVPDLDYEVEIRDDPDFINDFISRADDVANTDNFFVSAREEGLYLYAAGDNARIDRFMEWDEFEEVNIDWSVNNVGPSGGSQPAEDHAVDVLLATDFARTINHLDSTPRIMIGNHIPMRYMYDLKDEDESAMKVTYMQSPRIDQGDILSIPESIRQT